MPTIARVSNSGGSAKGVAAIDRFALWYGAIVLIVCVGLIVVGQGTSALGVVVGLGAFLSVARSLRRILQKPPTDAQQFSGMMVFAVIQLVVGSVIIFVGQLIQGDVILFFTMAFGTWQISAGVLVAFIIRVTKRAST